MVGLLIVLAIATLSLFLAAGIIWLFGNYGIDKMKNPEEWKDAGSSGEQIVYTTLRSKVHIPESQILRNVYVPTSDGRTSEIDILVISKKGLLVFECKNYAGNMYGDARHSRWVQYSGGRKSYFYNPFFQNRSHVKHLREYLARFGDLPIIPFVSTISRGKWKVKNLNEDDYFLGYNCHLKDILAERLDSELMMVYFEEIMQTLRPLARPSEDVREKHIERIRKNGISDSNNQR